MTNAQIENAVLDYLLQIFTNCSQCLILFIDSSTIPGVSIHEINSMLQKFSDKNLIDLNGGCLDEPNSWKVMANPLLFTYKRDKDETGKGHQPFMINGNNNIVNTQAHNINIQNTYSDMDLVRLVESHLSTSHKDYQELLGQVKNLQTLMNDGKSLNKGVLPKLNQFAKDHGAWLLNPLTNKLLDYFSK